jgi:hypothetical protein
LNSKPYEAQLDDQKAKKRLRRSSGRGKKPQKPANGKKRGKTTQRARKTQNQHSPLKSPSPNTLNASSPS